MKNVFDIGWSMFCLLIIVAISISGMYEFGSGILVGMCMLHVSRFIQGLK